MTIVRELTAGLNLNPKCYLVGHKQHGYGKFCNRSFCWNNWNVKPFRYLRG